MKRNKNNGITLIALIITIIIMLILVGVSINILIQSDLLGIAQNAGEKTKTAYEEEGTLGSKITIGGVEYNSIQEYIGANPEEESGPIKVKFTIEGNNNFTPPAADGTYVGSVVDGVPIPVGFTASSASGENTKAGGLVIYEGVEAVTDANVEVARTTRNQFVWVPVIPNQKIKLNITSEEEITSIELLDPWNEEMTISAPTGKTYTQEIEPGINGLYTLTVTAGDNEVVKTLRVSSLYEQDFWNDYHAEDFYWQSQGYESLQEMLDDWYYEGATVQDALEDVEWCEDYSDSTIETYKESVKTYGGFYIGRYEAGSDTARTSSGATLTTAYSMKNKYPYNYISQTNAINKANMYPTSTSVTSCLINAAAWDRTQNWLVETNAITKAEMFGDSKTWGNYYDSTFTFNGKYSKNHGISFNEENTTKPNGNYWLLGTGITEYTNKKNIYNLAGNLEEWTTEAYSSDNVVFRGRLLRFQRQQLSF